MLRFIRFLNCSCCMQTIMYILALCQLRSINLFACIKIFFSFPFCCILDYIYICLGLLRACFPPRNLAHVRELVIYICHLFSLPLPPCDIYWHVKQHYILVSEIYMASAFEQLKLQFDIELICANCLCHNFYLDMTPTPCQNCFFVTCYLSNYYVFDFCNLQE